MSNVAVVAAAWLIADGTVAPAPSEHGANVKPMVLFALLMLLVCAAAQVSKRAGAAAFGADVVSVTCCWYVVSISLTLFNKYFFTELYGGVNFPLLLSLWHMVQKGVLASIILQVYLSREQRDVEEKEKALASVGASPARSREHPAAGGTVFQFFQDKGYMRMALPIGVCTGLDVGLSNWAIGGYITVSLYTIVKTSVLAFTYILSVAAHMQPAHAGLTLSIATVCVGIGVASAADGVLQADVAGAGGARMRVCIGVAMTATASALAATRWVLTEAVLREHLPDRGTVRGKFQLLMCISPTAAASVAVLAVPFELADFQESVVADPEKFAYVGVVAAAAGVVALTLIFVEFALVHLASALTLAVAGHVKEILSVAFAVVVFKESCSSAKTFGMALALAGSLCYVRFKASLRRAAALEYTELSAAAAEADDEDEYHAPERAVNV
eukprot:TRINITY_DN3596_c0_g2_i2.p1 TRINITY_DN3596_c0_g2~~TRINITY_DN3596_c0_g2_i2.p1  ORF type:complete len:443 (+),score=135.73 TRINITY_DN3596_c0_g2_i2:81-1409(+)